MLCRFSVTRRLGRWTGSGKLTIVIEVDSNIIQVTRASFHGLSASCSTSIEEWPASGVYLFKFDLLGFQSSMLMVNTCRPKGKKEYSKGSFKKNHGLNKKRTLSKSCEPWCLLHSFPLWDCDARCCRIGRLTCIEKRLEYRCGFLVAVKSFGST